MNMKVVIAILAGAGILGAAMILTSRHAPSVADKNAALVQNADTANAATGNVGTPPSGGEPTSNGAITDRPPELPPNPVPANKPRPRTRTSNPAPPSPAPVRSEVTVPAGTEIQAELQNTLTSHESSVGDQFTMRVTQPVIVDGRTAIPAGATINGVVASVKPSGKIKGRGEITLAFKSVTDVNGQTHPIEAEDFFAKAKSITDRDAAVIAGGAGTGAIIGGVLGGKKGALIGGVLGGAAGTGTVLATKGPEVKLAPGTVLPVQLNSSIQVPAGPRS